jgi:hypothetical protein
MQCSCTLLLMLDISNHSLGLPTISVRENNILKKIAGLNSSPMYLSSPHMQKQEKKYAQWICREQEQKYCP